MNNNIKRPKVIQYSVYKMFPDQTRTKMLGGPTATSRACKGRHAP